jgi:hypothetical protein
MPRRQREREKGKTAKAYTKTVIHQRRRMLNIYQNCHGTKRGEPLGRMDRCITGPRIDFTQKMSQNSMNTAPNLQ